MTRRLVCLHGHFYQPPRENPWIEEVEVQDSANPFHDWNARISAECYGPNGAARLKTDLGRINDIVNNYRWVSFNFGPTLLSWMDEHAPDVYRTILEADADSVRRRGHGNAVAQGYNHAILPLCNERDRRTQIKWGIGDFRHRFGREPEGFWLPEAGADRATLRALADEGVRFTVLSPFQATRVRPPGGEFREARGAQFDPTRPYKVDVGDGKSMVVFFYDGPIARAVAFGEGLQNGDDLVGRLLGGLDGNRGHDELLTVAVDGETFGHHKKGGDEVLASALRKLSARDDVELVNLGQALELIPVDWEAEIAEGSSWSCAHGLERWRSDCGCQANGQPGWRQTWRAPLRGALDTLRDELARIFEAEGGKLLRDPWAVRDEFITLVLDPERAGSGPFLAGHASHPLDDDEQVRALQLLEMQRQAMLMYTSCGWFFSELSGLETVQILKYAARALQLAHEVTGRDLEPAFRESLAGAPSNLPELANGAAIYERYVKPSIATMQSVGAHFAIASLFDDVLRGDERMFCFRVEVQERRREQSGAATLALLRLTLRSLVTGQHLDYSACVLHFGGSDFRCGLQPYEEAAHAAAKETLFGLLGHASLAQLVRELDAAYPGRDYTLRDLFIDERRRVAKLLLDETTERYENDYLKIFEANRRLMEFLREISSPVPRPLQVAADVALTHDAGNLTRALSEPGADLSLLRTDLVANAEAARKLGARIDGSVVLPLYADALRTALVALARARDGSAGEAVSRLCTLLELPRELSLTPDLWEAQNVVWALAAAGRLPGEDQAQLAQLARLLWLDEAALLGRAARTPRPEPVSTSAPPAAAAMAAAG